MGFERHHSALIVASLVTVASFVAASAYTERRLARVDAISSTLERNAVPSVELLSRAAVRLAHLGQLLDELASPRATRPSTLTETRSELRGMEADIAEYVRLPPLAGERTFWSAVRAAVERAAAGLESAVAFEEGGGRLSPPPDWPRIDGDIDAAVHAVLATLQYDVNQSKTMARDVRAVRQTAERDIVQLNVVATLVAAFAVVFAYRASRRHDRLEHEHRVLLNARVTELDRFAGRVAHDVLSPLGTIATALALLSRTADARGQSYIDRCRRALQHVQQLVDALLTFARSGARPDRTAASPVDDVLRSVVADLADDASERGIELTLDAEPSVSTACSAGVLTSIAQNLVRNAIKYMGAGDTRRVVVRASAVGPAVRIDVEDTGPGIPAEMQDAVFEPFVRGAHDDEGGIGLGLATVKRLVEAHGGAITVQSTVGSGTLFRVDLPRASAP